MSNLLHIPFKKTYQLEIKDPANKYLEQRGGGHPSRFRDDIARWTDLRKNGVGGVAHVNRVDSALKYNAQLVAILSKLPPDIGLDIAYATVFNPASVPITLKNLAFERACVVFNLGALYSQLAASEDRSTADGIRRAISLYQNASGTFEFLATSILPNLSYSPDDDETPPDLVIPMVKVFQLLMHAQAQECFWQVAKLENRKNAIIARLAASVSALYQKTTATIRDASPSIRHLFPTDWIPHLEAKEFHFGAVSQYRKSIDELEESKYGIELARLNAGLTEAKKACEVARKSRVAQSVLKDAQALLDTLQKDFTRSERDNDLIYHQDVPAASALPVISPAQLAQITIPPTLSDPSPFMQNPIFGGLVSWGAREAINIYNDRKQKFVDDRVVGAIRESQQAADRQLRTLNLPASLDAFQKSVGLPPSLLDKAEEIRSEQGPLKIEADIAAVQELATTDRRILDEAMDVLDAEATQDEDARQDYNLPNSVAPSSEANASLVNKADRYRVILEQAGDSDAHVREKWDEWSERIKELTQDSATLEHSIPETTFSAGNSNQETRRHAQSLRGLLEDLDQLHASGDNIVRRAEALCDADDIEPKIFKAAAGLEKLAEVDPAMFEETLDGELAKYDRYLSSVGDIEEKQGELMERIVAQNEKYLQSRRDDPSVRNREQALQSLDLAYHMYREIIQNLEEGYKFYNGLAGVLSTFKDSCATWSRHRSQNLQSIIRRLASINDNQGAVPAQPRGLPTPAATPAPSNSFDLPPLDSDEWGFEEFKLPSGPRR